MRSSKIFGSISSSLSALRLKRIQQVSAVSAAVGGSALFSTSFVQSAECKEKSVRVGLCQILVGADKQKNLETAEKAVAEAASKGAKLIMLPEIFNAPYSNDSFGPYSEPIPFDPSSPSSFQPDPTLNPSSYAIQQMAKKYKVWLIAGSIPEKESKKDESPKLYNTCLVVNPKGEFVAKHRKVHLFDIDVPGKITFKESETLSPGNQFTLFETEYGKIGVGICYDLRFPEYAQTLNQKGATILAYPGAFNTTTGPAHWELLQRGRAIDNQLYVLTCSPARNPESKYQAWGHSSVISPWGEVLATTEHQPALVVADLDLERVEEVRRNIPILQQKRKDMYELKSK